MSASSAINRLLLKIGLSLLVVGIFILSYRGIFNRFWGDDWCYNAEVKNQGLLGAIGGYYDVVMYSANRFSLTLFSGLFYPLGIFGVIILPTIVIILWIMGLYKLIKNIGVIFNHPFTFVERLFLSTLVVYISLFIAPNQFQILYWRSAVLPYTFPILFLNFILITITNQIVSTRKIVIDCILAGLLTFLAVGFSEVGGAYILGVIGSLFLLLFFARRHTVLKVEKSLIVLGVALVAGGISYILLALSPVNALRQAMHYSDPTPITLLPWLTLKMTLQLIKTILTSYILPIGIFSLSSLLVGINWALSNPGGNLVGSPRMIYSIILIAIFAFFACYSMLIPSIYIERSIPEEGRALILPTYTLLSAIMAISFVIGKSITKFLYRQKFIKPRVLKIGSLFVCLAIGLYIVRTYSYAINTIPFFEKRAHVWDERDFAIKAAIGENKQSVDVREIDSYMGVLELHPEPNWLNYCAADYYGIDEIRSVLPWD